jgi:hypothetical protein
MYLMTCIGYGMCCMVQYIHFAQNVLYALSVCFGPSSIVVLVVGLGIYILAGHYLINNNYHKQ